MGSAAAGAAGTSCGWGAGGRVPAAGAGVAPAGGRTVQLGNHGADTDGFALRHADFQHAIGLGGQLKRGLVRFELGDDFVALYGLAVFLEPLGNGDFGDGFANGGNFNFREA